MDPVVRAASPPSPATGSRSRAAARTSRDGRDRGHASRVVFSVLVPVVLLAAFGPRAEAGDAPARRPAAKPESAAEEEFLKINFVFNRELYDLAIPRYTRFLEKYPDFEDKALAHYALALSHDALAASPAVASLSPAKAEAERTKHVEAAARQLQKALDDARFERRPPAFELLARCQLDLEDHAGAARSFKWLVENTTGTARIAAAFGLAETHYLGGEYEEAVARYQHTLGEIARRPPETPTPDLSRRVERARFHLGMALYRQGGENRDKAATLFDKLARGQGTYAENARYMLAVSLQEQGDDPLETLEHYGKLLASKDAKWQELALYGTGATLFELKRYDEAIARLDELAKRFPEGTHLDAGRLYRARALLGLGQVVPAAQALAALRSSPRVGEEASLWLARTYSSKDKRDTAVKILASALRAHPKGKLRGTLLLELINESIALERFDQSLEQLEKLEQLDELGDEGDPARAEQGTYLRAYCLHRSGKVKESTAICETFLEGYPRSRYRRRVAQLVAENRFLDGDYLTAASLYERYIAEFEGTLDDESRLLARYRIAEAHYYEGQHEEAIRRFGLLKDGTLAPLLKKSLERKDALYETFHYILGDAAYRRGDYGQTIRELRIYLAQERRGDEALRTRQDARFLLAHALQLEGQLAEARQAYREALVTDATSPHRTQMQFELAQISFEEKDYTEAERTFRHLLETDPSSSYTPHVLNFLGWIARHGGRHQEAETRYRKIVDTYPKHELASDGLYGLALALQSQSRFAEARKNLERLEKEYPDNQRTHEAQLERGITLAREERLEEALKIFQSLDENELGAELRDRLLYEEAWCYRGLERLDDAALAYEKILAAKTSPEADAATRGLLGKVRLELADVELERRRFDRARGILQSLLADGRTAKDVREKVLYQLCWLNHERRDTQAVSDAFETLRREFPQSDSVVEGAMLLGRCHVRDGRHEEAAELFRLVIKKGGDSQDTELARLSFAECLNEQREFEKARQELSQLLEERPESPYRARARFGLGWADENLERRKQAIAHYREAAKERSATAARAQFQIGQCFVSDEKYDDAIVEFLQVPARYSYPEWSARALLQVAGCFENLEDRPKARKYYEEVAETYPERDEGKLAQERLARLVP